VVRPTLETREEARPTEQEPLPPGTDPEETLRTLSEMIVPINDPVDLALRLEGKTGVPPTLEPPAEPYQIGDTQTFWVTNTDTNESFQTEAVLRYFTDHAYFWIEDGVSYDEDELQNLAETFETQIYPINREFFGSEWTPGVDGDPRLYILYVSGVGNGIAGYFSSNDSYNPQIVQYSNGHELFVFNSDNVSFDEEFTYGVLAHEFQHMIHWYRDRNESTWMNEGFSDLAMFLNGYSIGGHDFLYTTDPDIQLNDWPNDPSQTTPHYGASFLFMTYFLDRFGEDATKDLVADPQNGLDSIDETLLHLGFSDPLTGEVIGADDVFADWVVASYLQDDEVGDGRFTYTNYTDAPRPDETEMIRNCSSDPETRDVSQYGVDYIRIACRGQVDQLHIEGSTRVNVIPADPYSGSYAFWSNKGDQSDMTLTQQFDFSDVSDDINLNYRTWYDIEEDWDYLYLLVSTDGETWDMIETPSGTDFDPTGQNYGWAYTGLSGGGSQAEWIQESIDLSAYAGEEVIIRFEYITDAAVNGEGLLLDDIEIPAIDYASDFETDDGGWEAAGFARIQNTLPQTFLVSLISENGETQVNRISLSENNSTVIPLDFNAVDEYTLVISGSTRFTRQPAAYRFYFTP
jgi:hypothetical protein